MTIRGAVFTGFVTRCVTRCLRAKTYCHDNLGYWARKPLIRYAVLAENRGQLFALRRNDNEHKDLWGRFKLVTAHA